MFFKHFLRTCDRFDEKQLFKFTIHNFSFYLVSFKQCWSLEQSKRNIWGDLHIKAIINWIILINSMYMYLSKYHWPMINHNKEQLLYFERDSIQKWFRLRNMLIVIQFRGLLLCKIKVCIWTDINKEVKCLNTKVWKLNFP